MRSAVRPRMKPTACRLATSSRFDGAKSSASMLLEMSMVMTMAMPSCFISTVSPPIRGPAAAMTSAASAASAEHGRQHHPPPVGRDGRAGRVTSL